ncbi:hypothetical protein CVU76_01595 [Candidatus Dojkabacteria bacterium HGW-Dojkabacteria-1]|uniref:Regulatory protein RecX n=1 Tax=Candidatus Dojkabacteria bacterium HGW-Dojkabacteria-1 TaxID=2013761 RepID=A0A2N2F3C7_9BACT|nr:MAG: hypothetical protein CVU76_01595 [Candidatus Dojkabacteria bacterium HGW-Dojkabacteria-1]
MLITKLEYQKRDPNRVNLYLEGKFFCGISLDTLAKEALYEGLNIEEEVLDRIVKEELKARFLSRALEYISKSPKTEFQIKKYLKELKFKKKNIWYKEGIEIDWESMIDSIVLKLKELKYIDDENFARMFVQSRMRIKPRGKNVMISELISKGVSKDTAQMVCDEEVEDEYELLKKTFRKKYKGKKLDTKDSKMVGFLYRKGFSWDLIEKLSNDDTEE